MQIFPTPLCELAYKYGSDKYLHPGHQYPGHQYTEFYYEIFNNKRDRVKKVVEIGIAWGSSLYMWREFFPKAKIYGADNNETFLFQTERIKTYLCDQTKKADLIKLIKKVGKGIDLFVDDGSHVPNDQVSTCLTVMPLLNKRSLYVIEDVGHKEIIDQLGMYDCQFKRRSRMSRHDDRLLLVRHK